MWFSSTLALILYVLSAGIGLHLARHPHAPARLNGALLIVVCLALLVYAFVSHNAAIRQGNPLRNFNDWRTTSLSGPNPAGCACFGHAGLAITLSASPTRTGDVGPGRGSLTL
jgi:hypothetical protein